MDVNGNGEVTLQGVLPSLVFLHTPHKKQDKLTVPLTEWMVFLKKTKFKKGPSKWEKWIESFLSTLSTNLKKPGESPQKEDAPKQEEHLACPLDERRRKVAIECFEKLDADHSGALCKSEFKVILAQLNPEITEEQAAKSFKKAKVQGDEMDLNGFFRWAHKMFGKADDTSFDASLSLLSNASLAAVEEDDEEELSELKPEIAKR